MVCQNPKCRYYLNENGKDIIKSGRYKSTGHQRYYCYHCRSYFMETKGTPFYRKRLSEREIRNICKHLVDKNGIRSIERITGHHRDTIGTLLEDMAEYADQMNEYLTRKLGLSTSECSDLWRFVQARKRKLSVAAQEGLMKNV